MGGYKASLGPNLISIGDYSDISLRVRAEKEVEEDLSPFLPQRWLSTSGLMCILSLFRWDDSTLVLHSKYTDFDLDNVQMSMQMLERSHWPIRRKHTRIIIPYNPGNHWILIEADISQRTICYYDSLSGYDLSAICKYVEAKIKCIGEQFGQDYSTWNPPIDGINTFLFLQVTS